MSQYAKPAACFHKSLAPGETIQGRIPNVFTIDEGGVHGPGSADVEFSGQIHSEVVQEGFDSNGFQFAGLRIVLFLATGQHPKYGLLQIINDNTRIGTYANLLATMKRKQYPVIYTTYLNVVACASKMPGLILQNKGDPIRFRSDPLVEWPPKSGVVHLDSTVEFEERYNPGPTVFSIRPAIVRVVKP